MQFSELPNQCPYSVTDELLRLLEDPPAVFNVVAHKLAVVGMSESRWGRFDIVEEDFKEKRVCMSGTNDVRIAHKMMSQSVLDVHATKEGKPTVQIKIIIFSAGWRTSPSVVLLMAMAHTATGYHTGWCVACCTK